MEGKAQSLKEKESGGENPYFALQASWGMTKHMGGLKATHKLAELCHISRDSSVLVVGSGVGITPCYLARKHGCRVVGIDLSQKMVERAVEKARKEGIADKVEFRVADAQDLPFADHTFDAVICESVNAFVENKQKALNEYVRVTKPGGYVGINEVTWLEDPPRELAAYLLRVMGAEFLTGTDWKALLDGAGLRDTIALTYKTGALSQWSDEVKQIEFADFIKSWCRYFSMLVRQPEVRRFTREALSFPPGIFSLFRYFGYGLYAGRKIAEVLPSEKFIRLYIEHVPQAV